MSQYDCNFVSFMATDVRVGLIELNLLKNCCCSLNVSHIICTVVFDGIFT